MPPVDRAELLRLQLRRLAHRLDDGRDDEILERLDVVGIDDARIDLDRAQLTVAGDRRAHDAAADGRVDVAFASASCAACMSACISCTCLSMSIGFGRHGVPSVLSRAGARR